MRGSRSAARCCALGVAALALSCALAGCSDAPVNLGNNPDVIWWTDHETGDTSDWSRNAEGTTWTSSGGQLDVVDAPARSGNHALRSVVTSVSSVGMLSGAVAERAGIVPVDAFYSAWFYVPVSITSTSYWLVYKFRSRRMASDAASDVDAWDLDFLSDGHGGMQFTLFGHAANANETPTVVTPVPIGRWFQVEAFLRATNDNTGKLTIWIDGVTAFDVQARPTVPSPFVEWSVGAITEMIAPTPATIYVDDAAISTRRLGPTFPIFWRGNQAR
jgi:hypothetical protein